MPRTRSIKPAAGSPATAPATERSVATRSKGASPTLTHERIADDLAAFRKAGGRIEVLGVTRLLTRIDPVAPATKAASPTRAAAAKSRR
jgi:hypothetical protein